MFPTATFTVEPAGVKVTPDTTEFALLVSKLPNVAKLILAVLSATIEICLYSNPICPTPVVGDTLTYFSFIFL